MKTKKFERNNFVDSLCLRFGCELQSPSDEALYLAERSLSEIGRLCLADAGIEIPSNDFEVVRTAAVFYDVLSNALIKTVLKIYANAGSTWRRWCNSTDLSVLSGERFTINPVKTPGEVGPGQNFPEGTSGGTKEKVLLAKYGQTLDVLYELILNDDVDLIQRLLKEHIQACIRLENDVVYDTLESPGTINGEAYFHINYGNLITGSALAEDTLATAMERLRNMKINNVELRLRPAVLLVPSALEKTARKLVVALYNRDADPDRLDVVAESRLDSSSTSWYLAADKRQADSLIMGFLKGETTPRIDPIKAFNIDGKRYRIKHTVGCKAISRMGIIKNNA